MIKKESLVKIVGSGQVSQDAATLESYARDMSFVNEIRPRYVVKPQTGQDIQKLVKLANETMTPLVPVSSGPPHFRGDTVPGIGGAIIVDLSGMKKILRVDRPRRVAMVEPGVTFGELIPAAAKAGIRLNMPLLPRQSKSVVGSMLEREPVVMPKYQWDVSDPLACTGVIFGTGDEFRTGQAAGPGTVEEQSSRGRRSKSALRSRDRFLSQTNPGIAGDDGYRHLGFPALRNNYPAMKRLSWSVLLIWTPLLDMASWLIRLRMVNECFILNNTNLAAIFAKNWPADYQKIKSDLPAWIPLLCSGRL